MACGLMGMASAAITYVQVNNDGDSGISASNTYTHAIDFEGDATGDTATINGVAFTSADGDTGNFTRTVANGALSVSNESNNGTGSVGTTGDLSDLMRGFIYNNQPEIDGTGLQTYTLSGLTIGTTYDLRIYTHKWGTGLGARINTLVFDAVPGGTNESTGPINQDDPTGLGFAENDAYYINYRYTATDTSLIWTAANEVGSNASWHLYGLTNQVVEEVPEPGSCLLGALGSFLLLFRRRRS